MTTATATATAAVSPQLDEQRTSAFAERFLGALNDASMLLMTSIGHRTGLLDVMDGLPWATSKAIAAAAGLKERYVREWLGAMTAARVIDYRPADCTYRLPPEHARWLTRRASPENLAVEAQFVSVLGHVESQVVEKFRHGGGVAYECYHRFHEVMAEESAQTVGAALQEHILPLVPGLREQLEKGIDVLEIGCGSGLSLCKLARLFPASRFIGYDLCQEAVDAARREAQRLALANITFQTRDVTDLPHDGEFDLVCGFDVIHDQKAPAAVLGNIHRALRPGGTFLMQDISASSHLEKNLEHPLGTFLYTISTMHCMTVSLAQGGEGLGACWGEELALKMLKHAGFSGVKVHKLDHDFINSYYVARK